MYILEYKSGFGFGYIASPMLRAGIRWHHTACALSLLGSHNERCIFSEALDVFIMQGLGVAGAVEVFHECDECGAARWCAGSIVGDLVGHFGFVS